MHCKQQQESKQVINLSLISVFSLLLSFSTVCEYEGGPSHPYMVLSRSQRELLFSIRFNAMLDAIFSTTGGQPCTVL